MQGPEVVRSAVDGHEEFFVRLLPDAGRMIVCLGSVVMRGNEILVPTSERYALSINDPEVLKNHYKHVAGQHYSLPRGGYLDGQTRIRGFMEVPIAQVAG